MTYVRVSGKVNFTDDPEVIEKCFENSPVLTSQFGNMREVVIGYYLSDVQAEFESFSPQLPTIDIRFPAVMTEETRLQKSAYFHLLSTPVMISMHKGRQL